MELESAIFLEINVGALVFVELESAIAFYNQSAIALSPNKCDRPTLTLTKNKARSLLELSERELAFAKFMIQLSIS